MGNIRGLDGAFETAVTVRVWVDAAGRAMGSLLLPTRAVAGRLVAGRRQPTMPAEQAAVAAIRIAASYGLELVVQDPDGLWDGYMDWLDALPDALLEEALTA